ncbi:MAG: DUF4175 family protein [Deltaproteobacteria bacterium]|nr:DUF4175 family protein [Deltaproteobacteria bacterium]
MGAARLIADGLEALRRAARRELAVLSVGGLVGALLAAGCVALVLAQVGLPRVALMLLLAAAAAGVGAAVLRWRRYHPGTAGLAMAGLAERLAPELGTAVSSAVELARLLERGQVDFSRDLAELHLDRTAGRLQGLDLDARLRTSHRELKRRGLALVLTIAGITVLLALVLNTGRARLGALLFDPTGALQSDLPLVGDIELTYHSPAYTRLPPRVVPGGDGSISAVVGSDVDVAATSDREVQSASIRVVDPDGATVLDVPLVVTGGRKLKGRLSVNREARYRFAIVDADGERVEERRARPIHVEPDQFPEVSLDAPAADLELKDKDEVLILWHAKDDFGISEINLVLQKEGRAEPERVKLPNDPTPQPKRDGQYRLGAAELGISAGAAASFFLEVRDNDSVNGPKRAVSATRRVSMFSARKAHEDLLARERALVDAMVDWLGAELTAPFPDRSHDALQREKHKLIVGRMQRLEDELKAVVALVQADKLTSPEIASAFKNLYERLHRAVFERSRAFAALSGGAEAGARLAALQRAQVVQLEKDIIYFDDLLALQKIEELKATAKDLLAAQRELAALLQKFKETQDPALKAMLEQQIRELRTQMLELLQKMASIKQTLPGEYRNMEAATMLKLDDQLDRLEKLLQAGDLDAAAAELEQLANMVDNMVKSIDQAEEEYGGERYAELRQKLADFAQSFRELEGEQQTMAGRARELAATYRKRSVDKAAKSLDDLIKRARKKTAEALLALDELAFAPGAFPSLEKQVATARERLADLDALLANKNLAEAREVGGEAEDETNAISDLLRQSAAWDRGKQKSDAGAKAKASEEAARQVHEVNEMLDRLFPEPSAVMRKDELEEMARMSRKQEALAKRAQELGAKMDELSGELPLFGGEPKAALEGAENEMGQAVEAMRDGELPQASEHKRRAADELGKIRKALEQSSKKGGKGLPLPLGMSRGNRSGDGTEMSREEVQIPAEDKNRANPRYRKELMDTAKQPAPDRYEEAVRRYYQELIR